MEEMLIKATIENVEIYIELKVILDLFFIIVTELLHQWIYLFIVVIKSSYVDFPFLKSL